MSLGALLPSTMAVGLLLGPGGYGFRDRAWFGRYTRRRWWHGLAVGRDSVFRLDVGVGWFPLAPGEVFIPGYRVSRAYVNRVNITNTTVNVTKVTNVYNTVVINRNVKQHHLCEPAGERGRDGGFARYVRECASVARNVVSVPARELAAAPVSHMVAVEPVRSSVLGAGRPVANRPPLAVTSRPVVALRTPAPMPRSFGQRQEQAAGIGQITERTSLVRQQAPGRPVPVDRGRPQSQAQNGFHSFASRMPESNQAKPQPRVWEAQGTPEPEPEKHQRPRTGACNHPPRMRPQQGAKHPAQQGSHPQAKPVAAGSAAQQQQSSSSRKPASPSPQRQPNSHPPAPQPETAPKKGH